MKSIQQRKVDHLKIVLGEEGIDRKGAGFDQIRLMHRALPDVDLEQIDPSIVWMGKKLSFPLLISSMTGGSGTEMAQINQNLAAAANAEGVAFAVGSQRVFLEDEAAAQSFALRQFAPDTLLFANVGAVQLNYGVRVSDCQRVVDLLEADALFLHLNPLQEAIQPHGDTQFSNLWKKIAEVVDGVDVPVIVKEVGAGVSQQDVEQLLDAGVQFVDVAGSGGTSWSLVEAHRSEDRSLGECFADWGISTPDALRLLNPYRSQLKLIASGGIRSGVDMVKSLVLGASLCGVAAPFLEPACESVDAVRAVIQRFKREFLVALFLLGAKGVEDVENCKELIFDESRN